MFFQRLLSLSIASVAIIAVQAGRAGSHLNSRALLEERAVFEERASSRLIVTLKDGATPDSLQTKVPIISQWDLVPGFLVNKADVSVEELLADPNVLRVEEDGVAAVNAITQDDAHWGLERLTKRKALPRTDVFELDYTFRYEEEAGELVYIYVIDSGVYTDHEEFGGRAVHGKTFGNYDDDDNFGHGTHVAAIAAGYQYGVAKKAKVIAVKVLDGPYGNTADLISGLDWVNAQIGGPGHKSVVCFSLSVDPNDALDQAVRNLITNGVHVAVTAGNDNDDASNYSPGRVAEAITVGATNITDHRASFSNYGTVVDIYAPGEDIISAGIKDDADIDIQSGCSQAVPHVAGLIAYLISTEGQRDPDEMKDLLTDGLWSFSIPIVKDVPTPGEQSKLFAQTVKCNLFCYRDYWL